MFPQTVDELYNNHNEILEWRRDECKYIYIIYAEVLDQTCSNFYSRVKRFFLFIVYLFSFSTE